MVSFLYLCVFFFGLLGLVSVRRGAIFVPTNTGALETMIAFAKPKSDDRMVDLGAGDGRIVIAFAKMGVHAVGFEHNPLLVWWARRKMRAAGLGAIATMSTKNFWGVNLGQFNIIVIFGAPHIMEALEKKLDTEVLAGTTILSHLFPLPLWSPVEHKNGVFLYKKK